MVVKAEKPIAIHLKDLERYDDYVSMYQAKTLTLNHSVLKQIKYWGRVVAHRFDRGDLAKDLAQEMAVALATTSNFKGESSLAAYIVVSLVHMMKKLSAPIVKGKFKFDVVLDDGRHRTESRNLIVDSIDAAPTDEFGHSLLDELPDDSPSEFEQAVLDRIFQDPQMANLTARSQRVKVILCLTRRHLKDEGKLSERSIAREASILLGEEVKRYEVHLILEKFRTIAAKHLRR